MRARRGTDSFNLAFLDIMSCGLGAVILVFMLVKHNIGIEKPLDRNTVHAPQGLQDDIITLRQDIVAQTEHLQYLKQAAAVISETVQSLQDRIDQAQAAQDSHNRDLKAARSAVQSLKETIVSIKVPEPEDLIAVAGTGEEEYLIGLRVEGERIALLLDRSASMSAERLIDVIKIKSGSSNIKKQAKKWQRTQRIVAWLLARLPKDSEVAVIGFNDTARTLGTAGWVSARDRNGLQQILAEVQSLLPEGGTNLQAALQALGPLRPSHLYVITDGLPTVGSSRYAGLNPFANCGSLMGRSKLISGACRVQLFRHTIRNSGASVRRTHVILLPMEGDPDAANEYWRWVAPSGGLLISPSANWP